MPSYEIAFIPDRDFRYLSHEIIAGVVPIARNFYTFFTPEYIAEFNRLNVGPYKTRTQRQYTWFFTSMSLTSVPS